MRIRQDEYLGANRVFHLFTLIKGYIPDPDLHLSLFSGSIWPAGLRNYFMLEIHRRHNSERKMTLDQLLLEDKDEPLKT